MNKCYNKKKIHLNVGTFLMKLNLIYNNYFFVKIYSTFNEFIKNFINYNF